MADEDQWFRRGSWLFEASEEQFAAMAVLPASSTLYVGEPIAADVSDREYRSHEREIMGAMLFGMACECWLKGLIVMAIPRSSRSMRKRLDKWIEMQVGNRISSDASIDERMLVMLKLFDTAAYSIRAARYEAKRDEEDKARYKRVSNFKDGHNLLHLANEAQITSRLGKQDKEFLTLLTKANTLGRYPAPWTEQGLAPWGGIFRDERRRQRIRKAIKKRHAVLESIRL